MNDAYRSWDELARDAKRDYTRTQGPDMPELIIALRGGRPLTMAIPPRPDPDQALGIALMFRKAGDADTIVFITDSYIAIEKELDPPAAGEFQARFRAGDPKVSEALTCMLARGTGQIEGRSLPYRRRGREIEWQEGVASQIRWLGGRIPLSLGMIMQAPAMIDDPLLLGAHADSLPPDRERLIWHTTRGAIEALRNAGVQVHDFVTDLHPEWLTSQEP